MGWTDERVELLKKLWADGLSASQIAGRLGGVTRNAVIGKVHRLGLSGRATTSRIRSSRPRHRAAPPPAARPARVHYPSHGNTVLKPVLIPAPRAEVALAVVPAVVEALNVPSPLRVDLLDLRECMCRWPIGDPQQEDFHFCGRRKVDGLPYCEHHARLAYQPMQRRRK